VPEVVSALEPRDEQHEHLTTRLGHPVEEEHVLRDLRRNAQLAQRLGARRAQHRSRHRRGGRNLQQAAFYHPGATLAQVAQVDDREAEDGARGGAQRHLGRAHRFSVHGRRPTD